MSRSSSRRAQTEPIAAVIAVSALVIGIGMYAVFVQAALPGTSDATTADRAIDQVWGDLEHSGVFQAHEPGVEIAERVDSASLPRGNSVYVSVSAIEGGEQRVIDEAVFDHDGEPRAIADDEPPAESSVAERSIPVAVTGHAEVRAGTLRVEVW